MKIWSISASGPRREWDRANRNTLPPACALGPGGVTEFLHQLQHECGGQAAADKDALERGMDLREQKADLVQGLGGAGVFGQFADPQKFGWGRDRLARLVNQVADRTRVAGQLWADVTGPDLIPLHVALAQLATIFWTEHLVSRDDIGRLYRRYVWIVTDGLRPGQHTTWSLPIPALSTQHA